MPKTKNKARFWSFRPRAETNAAELLLYGIISSESWWGDEVTPLQFKADLDALGDIDELHIYINSDGGDVFAGQAIHSMLKRHSAHKVAHVDGLAASIASVIPMAADEVLMPRNTMMMIHNPWTWGVGNAADFRKMADDLDKIRESLIAAYLDKSGMDRDELIALMDAETWLTADEAVEYGLADRVEDAKAVAASLSADGLVINGQQMDLSRYRNVPKLLVAQPPEPQTPKQTDEHGLLSLLAAQRRITENRTK